MGLNGKLCPICKRWHISNWESTCNSCWQTLTPKQREAMVMLNHFREILRSIGLDLNQLPSW